MSELNQEVNYYDYVQGTASADALFDVPNPELEEKVPQYENFYLKKVLELQTRVLSPEETSELTSRVQVAEDAKKRSRTPDQDQETQNVILSGNEAMTQLVEGNVKLIAWFVRETMGYHKAQNIKLHNKPHRSKVTPYILLQDFASMPMDYADRIQAASIGFMEAIKRYDPEKGSLAGYAMWYMESELTRSANEETHYPVRIPAYMQQNMRRVQAVQNRSVDTATQPNLTDTTFETDLFARDVLLAARWLFVYKKISLDQLRDYRQLKIDEYNELELHGLAEEADEPHEVAVADAQAVEEIHVLESRISTEQSFSTALAKIPTRKLGMLASYVGLDSQYPKTLENVGMEYGVTRERVRQVVAYALSFLRQEIYFQHQSLEATLDRANLFGGVAEVVAVSDDEKASLGIDSGHIVFDRSPSDKYKSKKPKFVYKEDWTDK